MFSESIERNFRTKIGSDGHSHTETKASEHQRYKKHYMKTIETNLPFRTKFGLFKRIS